jgi:hypothetical protein
MIFGFLIALNKSFDRLRTNGNSLTYYVIVLSIPFVVSHELVEWSNHDPNQFVQRLLKVR